MACCKNCVTSVILARLLRAHRGVFVIISLYISLKSLTLWNDTYNLKALPQPSMIWSCLKLSMFLNLLVYCVLFILITHKQQHRSTEWVSKPRTVKMTIWKLVYVSDARLRETYVQRRRQQRRQNGRPSALSRDVKLEGTSFVPLFAVSPLQKSAIVFGREKPSVAGTPCRFVQTRKPGRGFLEDQPQRDCARSHSRWPGQIDASTDSPIFMFTH